MEVESFMNVTGANLHARRFGGSRRLYVVLERILAYFFGKLSGAHGSSVPLAKPGRPKTQTQTPSISRNLFLATCSFGLLLPPASQARSFPTLTVCAVDGACTLTRSWVARPKVASANTVRRNSASASTQASYKDA